MFITNTLRLTDVISSKTVSQKSFFEYLLILNIA